MVNKAELRQFITRYFSDLELDELCFDYYPDLLNQFTTGMSKSQKVIALISYCERRGLSDHLLGTLGKLRPAAYQEQFGLVPKRQAVDQTAGRDPNRIFLSHASQDATFARQLADDLRHNGFDVWMAPESIEPGEKWVDAIERGLETSGIFVLVITPHAAGSKWVRDESNYAIARQNKGEMRIFTLHVGEGRMPPMWSVRQHISFREEYDEGLRQLLAALRPHRFAVRPALASDTAALRAHYQLELEEREGLPTAVDFLNRELETPDLYQDEEFFARLMQMYWQTGNWRQARERARSLASRVQFEDAALKSDVWQGLTAMAEFLSDGQRMYYEAELQAIRATVESVRPEMLPVVENQRRWLIDWRIDTLVTDAEQIVKVTKGMPSLKAIEYYAEAYDWQPGNRRIKAKLNTLCTPLIQNLANRIRAAQLFTFQGSLVDSLERAETELATLRTIQRVAEPLDLSHDEQQDLEDAVQILASRLGMWQKVQSKINEAQRKIDSALGQPQPFQGEDGGWDFQEARSLLYEAQMDARGDHLLQRPVQRSIEELDGLEERALTLNDLVFQFRRAALEEDFDVVVQSAQSLSVLWTQRRDSDGFAGLEELIHIAYPYARKPRTFTLGDHIKLAQDQKRNLQEWTVWADEADAIFQKLRRVGDEQQGTLAMLKARSRSLNNIKDDCDAIIQLCTQFSSLVDVRPQNDPKSIKALKQNERISQTKIAEVGDTYSGYLGRAMALRAEAKQQLSQLENGPLSKLRAALDRLEIQAQQVGKKPSLLAAPTTHIPEVFFKEAELYLKESVDIDPANPDLKRLKDKFATYNDKRASLW